MADTENGKFPCYAEWVWEIWREADALEEADRSDEADGLRRRVMDMVRDGVPCGSHKPCFQHCALTQQRFPWAEPRLDPGDE